MERAMDFNQLVKQLDEIVMGVDDLEARLNLVSAHITRGLVKDVSRRKEVAGELLELATERLKNAMQELEAAFKSTGEALYLLTAIGLITGKYEEDNEEEDTLKGKLGE
jgi:hypothetical protein